ncbi:hypothetical protein Q3F28_11815 [Enterococcus faecium]|nr:hypothetical protein [Enterococcus faecium]
MNQKVSLKSTKEVILQLNNSLFDNILLVIKHIGISVDGNYFLIGYTRHYLVKQYVVEKVEYMARKKRLLRKN